MKTIYATDLHLTPDFNELIENEIMNITQNDYNTEIKSIAECMVEAAFNEYDEVETIEQAEELINDTLLHETIDSHQWIIYYSYNDDVIRYSDNADAYQDIYSNEDVGAMIVDKGLDNFGIVRAYWAMYTDVQEQLQEALDSYEGEEA